MLKTLWASYQFFILHTYIEIHFAGGREVLVLVPRGKLPNSLKMAEEGSVSTHGLVQNKKAITWVKVHGLRKGIVSYGVFSRQQHLP